MPKWLSLWMLFAASCGAVRAQDATAAATPAPASDATEQSHAAKWPLRLHILAVDDTHHTVRMQPNWSSGTLPDLADGSLPSGSGGADGPTLGGGDDDFAGAGRADLVTPPDGTAGVNFSYEGCWRVRVPPGFLGLEARWIKPGAKLEVMIPTDALANGAAPVKRCTLKVVPQELIYLRIPNGKIVRVSEEAYRKKPALRAYLSGGTETLKRRTARPPQPAPAP